MGEIVRSGQNGIRKVAGKGRQSNILIFLAFSLLGGKQPSFVPHRVSAVQNLMKFSENECIMQAVRSFAWLRSIPSHSLEG